MRGTVYTKFIIGYLLFGLFSFLTIAILTSNWTFKHLAKERAQELYNEANLIANQYGSEYYNNQMTRSEVSIQLKAVDTFLNVQIWMVDTEGNIIINTRDSSLTTSAIPDFDPAFIGRSLYQIGSYYNMFPEEMITVSAPITSNFRTRGYIIIHSSIRSLKSAKDALLNISYITLLVIFLLSLIFLVVFTIIIYRPLKKITAAANAYAAGDLKYKVNCHSNDEMGYLAATLNYMAHELNKSEEYQKNFIANVSHDFRSPLTSIKGYVEAMKDGTIPYEMQEKYLDIVIFETERLRKLTSSLLTLNSYDSRAVLLDISTFDINQVIKNTLAAFEGICGKKKISFVLTLDEKVKLVSADMGKIQQVLYNLIDNAIKFSHNNSSIKITVSELNGKVFVSVKDSGIGIPKDSIGKIWDRFYKTDLSRGKDKKGTGLGLSITKEIIQSHNENIDVISTEGVGTEFIFTLPKQKN
ncbi:MAG: HAMP domain-containing histidine kinase [Lachnospiraceae bacterium]|nr:HAMP domain-containing histidine kinase [Lachnospiraceae bacterium]